MNDQERFLRPGNPINSGCRSIISFYMAREWYPRGQSDKVRLLDNFDAQRILIESRFPDITDFYRTYHVSPFTTREVLSKAFIKRNRWKIPWKERDERWDDVEQFKDSFEGWSSTDPGKVSKLVKQFGRSWRRRKEDGRYDEFSIIDNPRRNMLPREYQNIIPGYVRDGRGYKVLWSFDHSTWHDPSNFKKVKDVDYPEHVIAFESNDDIVTRIADLDVLENLESLTLNHQVLKKIDGIENLEKLKYLELRGNQLRKIENIEHLKDLEVLDLVANRIEDIDVDYMAKFKKLKELNIWNNYGKARESCKKFKRRVRGRKVKPDVRC